MQLKLKNYIAPQNQTRGVNSRAIRAEWWKAAVNYEFQILTARLCPEPYIHYSFLRNFMNTIQSINSSWSNGRQWQQEGSVIMAERTSMTAGRLRLLGIFILKSCSFDKQRLRRASLIFWKRLIQKKQMQFLFMYLQDQLITCHSLQHAVGYHSDRDL